MNALGAGAGPPQLPAGVANSPQDTFQQAIRAQETHCAAAHGIYIPRILDRIRQRGASLDELTDTALELGEPGTFYLHSPYSRS